MYSHTVYSAWQIDEDWGPGYKSLHYWAVIRGEGSTGQNRAVFFVQMQCLVHIVRFTVYGVQSVANTVKISVFSVQCTLYYTIW